MNKSKLADYGNILIFVLAFYAWSTMFFFGGKGDLSAANYRSLRYFTTLSNLLVGGASLWLFIARRNDEIQKRRDKNTLVYGNAYVSSYNKAFMLKYIATASVAVTFFTVLFFLGPIFGYASMYSGPNYLLHLIVPVLSIISFCIFDDGPKLMKKDALRCCIPVVLYAVYYIGNILINGVGEWGAGRNDFYGFMNWGIPVGILIFLVIICFSIFIGFVLGILNRRFAYEGE